MTDLTPGLTMAREAAKQLRGGGSTTWRGREYSNPTFAAPPPWTIAGDFGLTCGNCASAATRRTGPQERECIRCRARWTTEAKTADELAIERFKAKQEAAKR